MPEQTASPSLADPEARRRLMSEVDATPGLEEARLDPRRQQHRPSVRRHDRGQRRPPRGPARHHHRADRPQRCGQDDVLQPDHRLRQADLRREGRPLVVRGQRPRQDLGLERGPLGHGPHLPAHQGAEPDDGDGQHDARRAGPGRREPPQVDVQAALGRARRGRSRPRPWSSSTGSTCWRRRTTSPAASPAASASCSRWPGR